MKNFLFVMIFIFGSTVLLASSYEEYGVSVGAAIPIAQDGIQHAIDVYNQSMNEYIVGTNTSINFGVMPYYKLGLNYSFYYLWPVEENHSGGIDVRITDYWTSATVNDNGNTSKVHLDISLISVSWINHWFTSKRSSFWFSAGIAFPIAYAYITSKTIESFFTDGDEQTLWEESIYDFGMIAGAGYRIYLKNNYHFFFEVGGQWTYTALDVIPINSGDVFLRFGICNRK